MVHYLQDETTHRLNIDVIDLSNFIFICKKQAFLNLLRFIESPDHYFPSAR